MRQFRCRINESGFTFIESLLHLMTFALCMHLFLLFFYWKAPIERHYTDRYSIAWELFAADLQDELTNLHSFEVNSRGNGINFRTERGRIAIGQINQVVRKTIDGQGHVPFLTDVANAQFQFTYPVLTVQVTMLDDSRRERTFTVGDYSQ